MAWSASIVTYCRAADTTAPFTGGLSNQSIDYPQSQTPKALANGTGANQVNLGFGDQRTYDSTGATLNVASLAKASTNTNAAAFSAIKYMAIFNEDATNDVVVGNAASNQVNLGFSAATITLTIQEGGHFCFFNPTAAGWTTSSANNLKIASAAGTPTVTLILLGLS